MTNPTPHGQVPEALQLADEISKAGAFPAYPRAPYEAAAAAPQLSPTAQGASSAVLKAIREANMQLVRTGDNAFMLVPYKVATAQAAGSVPALDRDRIREIFMAHGFTVKEGQTDLKQYVYDAAEALLRAARAQADSVQEDVVRMNWLDTDGGMCVFHIGKTWYTRPSYGLPHRKRTNLRAAIDAAMADAARAAQKEGS